MPRLLTRPASIVSDALNQTVTIYLSLTLRDPGEDVAALIEPSIAVDNAEKK